MHISTGLYAWCVLVHLYDGWGNAPSLEGSHWHAWLSMLGFRICMYIVGIIAVQVHEYNALIQVESAS